MSTNALILIPVEPIYQPGQALVEQAKELLKTFVPRAKEVTIHPTEEVEFIATGSNLEKIVCLFCHSTLDEQ